MRFLDGLWRLVELIISYYLLISWLQLRSLKTSVHVGGVNPMKTFHCSQTKRLRSTQLRCPANYKRETTYLPVRPPRKRFYNWWTMRPRILWSWNVFVVHFSNTPQSILSGRQMVYFMKCFMLESELQAISVVFFFSLLFVKVFQVFPLHGVKRTYRYTSI